MEWTKQDMLKPTDLCDCSHVAQDHDIKMTEYSSRGELTTGCKKCECSAITL